MEEQSQDRQLEHKLQEFLRPLMEQQDLCVGNLDRMSTGMSRENWTFDIAMQPGGEVRESLILRRDPLGGMLDTDRRAEFEVLVAVREAGYPIPRVIGVDLDGTRLGRPSLIMEIAPGKCEYHALTDERPLETRKRLASDFLQLLVDLQAIDWQAAGLAATLEDPGEIPALHEVERWNSELQRAALEPMPELELIRMWLVEHARAARKIVLVHGDFKPGNALIHDDHFSAVLDWETTHLGDPLEDLGWITNQARASEHQIPGHWERADIAAAFRDRTGYDFDEQELHWWNVFSCWKLAVIVLTGLRSTIDGKFDRIHHNPTWLYRRMFKMVEFI